jgi:peroxiredoxin
MTPIDSADLEMWVDVQLASLAPADDWRPDAAAGLNAAQARRRADQSRRLRWSAGVLTAGVLALSVPGTWAFGAKCVAACVNAASRATQLWQGDGPAASHPPVTGVRLGDLAPDFVGTDLNGAAVHLTSFRGQVVVLNFWATWCAPCRSEIPQLNALQTEFRDRGLRVIGVSVDTDGWTAIERFRDGQPIDYVVTLADDDVRSAFAGVSELPMTLIVDREGRIVIKQIGVLSEGTQDDRISALLVRPVF